MKITLLSLTITNDPNSEFLFWLDIKLQTFSSLDQNWKIQGRMCKQGFPSSLLILRVSKSVTSICVGFNRYCIKTLFHDVDFRNNNRQPHVSRFQIFAHGLSLGYTRKVSERLFPKVYFRNFFYGVTWTISKINFPKLYFRKFLEIQERDFRIWPQWHYSVCSRDVAHDRRSRDVLSLYLTVVAVTESTWQLANIINTDFPEVSAVYIHLQQKTLRNFLWEIIFPKETFHVYPRLYSMNPVSLCWSVKMRS